MWVPRILSISLPRAVLPDLSRRRDPQRWSSWRMGWRNFIRARAVSVYIENHHCYISQNSVKYHYSTQTNLLSLWYLKAGDAWHASESGLGSRALPPSTRWIPWQVNNQFRGKVHDCASPVHSTIRRKLMAPAIIFGENRKSLMVSDALH